MIIKYEMGLLPCRCSRDRESSSVASTKAARGRVRRQNDMFCPSPTWSSLLCTAADELYPLSVMTITAQPYAIIAPSPTSYESDQKGCSHQHDGTPPVARRCRCDRARSRRVVTALLLAVFSFALFLLASFLWNAVFNEGSWLGSLGLTEDGSGSAWSAMAGFAKRQATDSGNGQNTFINRKCM